jgi:hypothetical protein
MKKAGSILLICLLLQTQVMANEHKVKEKIVNGLTSVKNVVVFVLEIPLMVIAFPFAYAMFSNDNPNK